MDDPEKGVVPIIASVQAGSALHEHVKHGKGVEAGTVSLWNGRERCFPDTPHFWMISTPTCFFHRLVSLDGRVVQGVRDISALVLDEVHLHDTIIYYFLLK